MFIINIFVKLLGVWLLFMWVSFFWYFVGSWILKLLNRVMVSVINSIMNMFSIIGCWSVVWNCVLVIVIINLSSE